MKKGALRSGGNGDEVIALGGGRDHVDNEIGVVGISIMSSGIEQNRIINVQTAHPGTDATNVATWTIGEDIHSLLIPPNHKYLVNFPGTPAQAKTELEKTASINTTVLYKETYAESHLQVISADITRLDLVTTGTANTITGIGAWS